MKKGLMKKGLMFVGALSMCLSSVVLLVPAMASSMRAAWDDDIPKASEEDAPYLFSDGRLDDDGHKYMLQYADLEGGRPVPLLHAGRLAQRLQLP